MKNLFKKLQYLLDEKERCRTCEKLVKRIDFISHSINCQKLIRDTYKIVALSDCILLKIKLFEKLRRQLKLNLIKKFKLLDQKKNPQNQGLSSNTSRKGALSVTSSHKGDPNRNQNPETRSLNPNQKKVIFHPVENLHFLTLLKSREDIDSRYRHGYAYMLKLHNQLKYIIKPLKHDQLFLRNSTMVSIVLKKAIKKISDKIPEFQKIKDTLKLIDSALYQLMLVMGSKRRTMMTDKSTTPLEKKQLFFHTHTEKKLEDDKKASKPSLNSSQNQKNSSRELNFGGLFAGPLLSKQISLSLNMLSRESSESILRKLSSNHSLIREFDIFVKSLFSSLPGTIQEIDAQRALELKAKESNEKSVETKTTSNEVMFRSHATLEILGGSRDEKAKKGFGSSKSKDELQSAIKDYFMVGKSLLGSLKVSKKSKILREKVASLAFLLVLSQRKNFGFSIFQKF